MMNDDTTKLDKRTLAHRRLLTGKTAKSRTSPRLVAGMSGACRGRHGEVGVMESEIYCVVYAGVR